MWTAHDTATCTYHAGLNPFTKQPVTAARSMRDRTLQRALTPFFKPANDFEVREALPAASRSVLTGGGCDELIPANPPREAPEAKRKRANAALTKPDHDHTVPNPAKKRGYRPGWKALTRRDRPRRPEGEP